MTTTPPAAGERARPTLAQLARIALWIGLGTFGGGYVVIGRIKRAFVEEHRWTEPDFFAANVAVASALPGTISSNLFTLLAFRLRGVKGAFVASLAFLAPSLALMTGFGVFHARAHSPRGRRDRGRARRLRVPSSRSAARADAAGRHGAVEVRPGSARRELGRGGRGCVVAARPRAPARVREDRPRDLRWGLRDGAGHGARGPRARMARRQGVR